jgi:hypothetical protein
LQCWLVHRVDTHCNQSVVFIVKSVQKFVSFARAGGKFRGLF